ncbi:MAG: type II toxin-antitoxin system RnlA family toxin [Lachnospiraceae bacterium]|nr:type II toxin-antitoxin system RnlA family toxin [Lachnospiraceae bacterium]
MLAIIELIKEQYISDLTETTLEIAHGISYRLSLGKKDKICITHYDNNKLMVQGKPQTLFSTITSYITELVDIEEIPRIFNQTYSLNIDKKNVLDEYQYYLPNSYGKFNPKMERVLHQAVYNLNISGDMFDGTFLAQPAMRVLEGHLKQIVINLNIAPDNRYIKQNGFDFFSFNGANYQLNANFTGKATQKEIAYLEKCYTFYHNNRHVLEHWDDPTAPLDSTRLINCSQAKDLIKRTLKIIDEFYAI